jgi:hypothetical protein
VRESSLPMQDIVDAVNDQTDIYAYIDDVGYGGGFLSEFIAYHGVWYKEMHDDPSDPLWTIAAGHIHVGVGITIDEGVLASEITLRALTDYLDTQVPAPAGWLLLGVGLCARRRRR